MEGIFGISINSTTYQGSFLKDLSWGTFYQQHLGEEWSGLAVFNEGEIKHPTPRPGLFRPGFEGSLSGLNGTEGIGYCGSCQEPLFLDTRRGSFSTCLSGRIINCRRLAKQLKSSGHLFSGRRGDDQEIEVVSKLVAQGENMPDGISFMTEEIQGAYSLLVLTEEGIFAARSPDGHWPLVLAAKEGATAVAFDPCGLDNMGFEIIRDLRPGEIVRLKNGHWEAVCQMSSQRVQRCSFLLVYTLFPTATLEGFPVSRVRKELGATLARRDIEDGFIPDIVTPVPDSGRSHALGYFQEFCRQMNQGRISRIPLYDELLMKYPYAGRSFTPRNPKAREREARIKLLKNAEDYEDSIIVVCDDSIVRGNQMEANLVPMLRSLRVAEIHLRISNPELRSHCPWGKATKKGEVLASREPLKEDKINFLGVEGLEYNLIEDLVEAIGLPREELCVDCSLAP